jgi:hypothetical protein
MSLRKDAMELSFALNEIVEGLCSYKSGRNKLCRDLASRLAPMVERYDQAVYVRRSRQDAAEAISALSEDLHAVSTASSKGEMDFAFNKAINNYWRLHTIFRESRHREESL